MKKFLLAFALSLLLLAGCSSRKAMPETAPASTEATVCPTTDAATVPTTQPTLPPPPTEPLVPAEPVYHFTAEEKEMLLKIGMAERGNTGCPECIALVMRTLLNRVEAPRFGSSIRGVLFAPEQFTPVLDGSYYSAKPNEICYDALDMVIYGWDESQGAFYYEWCEGESWHSQNLNLLLQHCDVRFYN